MRFLAPLTAWLPALIIAFVMAISPASAEGGTVQGTVQYGSSSVPMTHAYARETRPSPTRDGKSQILILVTDRPAPEAVIASRQSYYTAARQGQIRGFLIALEPPQNRARLAIFAAGGDYDDRSVPDSFSGMELADLKNEGGWVSGKLTTAEPIELIRDGNAPEEPATYSINLRFRVPIERAPQPSAILTGDAARGSEQAAAALEALQLIRTGTPAEIRARLHPSHPIWTDLATGQADAILVAARQSFPAPSAFLRSIERVLVYGDQAIVVFRDSEGSGTVSLRSEEGVWKLAASPVQND